MLSEIDTAVHSPHVPTAKHPTPLSRPAARIQLIVAAAFVLLSALLGASAASAEISDTPRNWWGVDGIVTPAGVDVDSEVWAIEQMGNTVYVGGKFTDVQGNSLYPQSFLAAYRADTGKWIDWWTPVIDGPVYSLQASPDGSKLFVGGEFSTVNGQNISALAALDPATGSPIPGWTTTVSGGAPAIVLDMEATGNDIFAVGAFTTATEGGQSYTRMSAMAFNSVTGAIDTSFDPAVENGSVWTVSISPALDRVYLGGYFTSVAGDTDAGNFAVVDQATGAPLAGLQNHWDAVPAKPWQLSSAVAAGHVYTGGGGNCLNIYTESTMSPVMTHCGDGDVQSLVPAGNRLYVGGHMWAQVCSTTQAVKCSGGVPVSGAFAVDTTTLTIDPTFAPQFNGTAGVWDIEEHSTDGCFWFGGNLTQSGGIVVHSLARLCDAAGPGPAAGPPLVEPVVAPLACYATVSGIDSLDITWSAANNDNADDYVIRRSKNGGSLFWTAKVPTPGSSWTNNNVAPGTYSYTVETVSDEGAVAQTICGPTGGVTLAAPAVLAPSSCSTVLVGTDDIDVDWVPAANDQAVSYVVRRSKNAGSFYWAAKVNAPATTWTNSSVGIGGYSYTVEAVGADGSNAMTTCGPAGGVVVAGPAAVAPVSCSAALAGSDIDVTWVAAANDQAVKYVVKRSKNGGSFYWAAMIPAPGAAWTNTGMAPGSYVYSATAIASNGSSATTTCTPTAGIVVI